MFDRTGLAPEEQPGDAVTPPPREPHPVPGQRPHLTYLLECLRHPARSRTLFPLRAAARRLSPRCHARARAAASGRHHKQTATRISSSGRDTSESLVGSTRGAERLRAAAMRIPHRVRNANTAVDGASSDRMSYASVSGSSNETQGESSLGD